MGVDEVTPFGIARPESGREGFVAVSLKAGAWGFDDSGGRRQAVFTCKSITFHDDAGGSVVVRSYRLPEEARFESIRKSAAKQAWMRTAEGRAARQASFDSGRWPEPVEVEWRFATILVDRHESGFEVYDLPDGSWAAVGRLPDAVVTIVGQHVNIADICLERLAEDPVLTMPDVGPAAPSVRADLDARLERFSPRRIRSMSDHLILQNVAHEHLIKVSRRYSVPDETFAVLQDYWMSQIESKLGEKRILQLLHLGSLEMIKDHRTHGRLARFHLDRLWWNTLGPGGRTWFGDHLPIRRLVFRMRWRP